MDLEVIIETMARASMVYVVLLIVVRILGKREVGATTAFDFIVALILGEVTDEIIFGNVTIYQGLVAIGVVAVWHYTNSWGSFRSQTIDRLTGAEPTEVVKDGQLVWAALAKERISEGELWSELRLQGIEELREVKRATVEPNGQVSVIKQEWAKNLQKADLPTRQRESES